MPKYAFPLGETANSIANALSWATGKQIPEGQVIVEKTGNAGEFLVTVYESADSLKKVIKFTDEHGSIPTDTSELCLVGYRTNRKPAFMSLTQHGQIIGATESGKSGLLHVLIAHATRCVDCIVWVGGNWKLYNLVGQWLEPYLSSGLLPPIDYVAHGQQDVCNMLAAFLKVAHYRMSVPFQERENFPYIILVLDEVTKITGNKSIRADVNGHPMCASEALATIATGTADAGCYMHATMHRDTFDNLGTEGGTTIAQMQFSFIGRIRDFQTVGRVTNDYGISIPKRTGEFWVDLGPNDDELVNIRVPYAQTADPRKPVLHDGPKIPTISWERREITPYRQMDPGSANAAGEHYAGRYTLVTQEYLDYVRMPQATFAPTDTSTNKIVNPGVGSGFLHDPTPEEQEAAQAEYLRLCEKYGITNGGGDESEEDNADAQEGGELDDTDGTVDLATYRTQKERVLVVVQSEGPISRDGIIAKLGLMGHPVRNPNVITNALGDYVKINKMGRTDDSPPKYYAV